jgi:hypothetical protein
MFKVRWLGYEESDDSWLPWSSVKDFKALDEFIEDDHPESRLQFSDFGEGSRYLISSLY